MKKVIPVIFAASSAFLFTSGAQTKPLNERLEVPRVKKASDYEPQTAPAPETATLIPSQKKLPKFEHLDMVEFGVPKKAVAFIMGEGAQSDPVKRGIRYFKMNRFETTYKMWYQVRVWGEKNGYTFANPGQEGSEGLRGKVPTSKKCEHPVTMINWYDCIVWCNALSEMCGLTPCYTYDNIIIRDSSDTTTCDLSKCNFSASGYRLPTETEWEYAARKNNVRLQSGALASGQIDVNGQDDENLSAEEVAWYCENSDGTHTVGTAGTPFEDSAITKAGDGNPNGAGLFDMSGNVLEWCWDWKESYTKSAEVPAGARYSGPEYGSERIMRGGSWNEYTIFIGAGDRYSFDPNESYNYFGFRIASR